MKDFKEYILTEEKFASFTTLVKKQNFPRAKKKAEALLGQEIPDELKKNLEDFIKELEPVISSASVVSEGEDGVDGTSALDSSKSEKAVNSISNQNIGKNPDGKPIDTVILGKLQTAARELDKQEKELVGLDDLYTSKSTKLEKGALLGKYRDFFKSFSSYIKSSYALTSGVKLAAANDNKLSEKELREAKFFKDNLANSGNWSFIVAVLWLKTASRTLYKEIFTADGGAVREAKKYGFTDDQAEAFKSINKALGNITLDKDIMSKLPHLGSLKDLNKRNAQKVQEYVESLKELSSAEKDELISMQNTQGNPEHLKGNPEFSEPQGKDDNILGSDKDTDDVKSDIPADKKTSDGIYSLKPTSTKEEIISVINSTFGDGEGGHGSVYKSRTGMMDETMQKNDAEQKTYDQKREDAKLSKMYKEDYNPVFSAISKNKVLTELFKGRIDQSAENTATSWRNYKSKADDIEKKYRAEAMKAISGWDDNYSSTPQRLNMIYRLKNILASYIKKMNSIYFKAKKANSYSSLGNLAYDIGNKKAEKKAKAKEDWLDSTPGRIAKNEVQEASKNAENITIDDLKKAAQSNQKAFNAFAWSVKHPGMMYNLDRTTGNPDSKITILKTARDAVAAMGLKADDHAVDRLIKAFGKKATDKEGNPDIVDMIDKASSDFEMTSTESVIFDDNEKIRKNSKTLLQKIQAAGFTDLDSLVKSVFLESAASMSFSEFYALNEALFGNRAKQNRKMINNALNNIQDYKAPGSEQNAQQQSQEQSQEQSQKQPKAKAAQPALKLSADEKITLAAMILQSSDDENLRSRMATYLTQTEKDAPDSRSYISASDIWRKKNPDAKNQIAQSLAAVMKAAPAAQGAAQPAAPNPAPAQPAQNPAPQNTGFQSPNVNDDGEQETDDAGNPVSVQTSVTTASAGSYNIPGRLYKKMIRRKLGF